MDSKSIAKLLIDEIVCRYSAPKTLLSDQGAQFMSSLLKSSCDYLNTKKINTTAYHPQCNGLTERFNGTLCQILSMYIKNNQRGITRLNHTNLSILMYKINYYEKNKIAR